MLADADLISVQEVRTKVDQAYAAFQHYRNYTQEQADAVVESMAAAARENARRLAEMAVEETGYGNARDKVTKNLLSADLLPRTIRGMRTIGILRELPEQKLIEIAVPVGVVAAILPTTNPTSTAIYKTLIALKSGNAIVLSPHPRAKRCTCETVSLLAEAARRAGAPEGIIHCVMNATMEGTHALMRHPRTSVILSTGGSGIVKAAYSSGKPAFGVGPGNVPVLLDEGYDAGECVKGVVAGKSFDYGTICSSEQTLVALESRRSEVLDALRAHRAHLCSPEQGQALARLLITPKWTINPDCVGQAPEMIARMAGFDVSSGTSILAVPIGGVGKQHPLSMEKLSPVLSLLFVSDWEAQIRACQAILKFGGLGHTCGIYSNDEKHVREYGLRMPAFRVVVNTPTPLGSTGVTTGVLPAMTLGCGAMAGNSTGDNVGPMHLMNVKRIAYVARKVEEAFSAPAEAGAGPAVATRVTKAQVAAAVERYLASRGPGAPDAVQAPAAVSGAPPARLSAAEQVVNRFLAARAAAAAASCCAGPAPNEPAGATSATSVPPAQGANPDNEPAREQTKASPAEVGAVGVAEFVCEADVRSALHSEKKIYIGPKTIVTPAARELAHQHEILVVARR